MNFTVNWISLRVFVSIEILFTGLLFTLRLKNLCAFVSKFKTVEDIKLRNFVYSYTIIAKRLTKY